MDYIKLAIAIIGILCVFCLPAPGDELHTADILNTATYNPVIDNVVNWEDRTFDGFLLNAVQEGSYIDIPKFLGLKVRTDHTVGELKLINKLVNDTFKYRLDDFDLWHPQSPRETIVMRSGDCKAFAVFKFYLLKQLGYKNVKLITIEIPDGLGNIAGHALVLLNDIFVMDINYPYFYPYAYLRANSGFVRAYDENGIYEIIH